jgi:uncharacterized protein YbdZ (MbtH family)
MTLESVRKEWERKLEEILVVTHDVHGYSTVYVVLKNSDDQYNMHRYFKAGDSWVVSVDKQGKSVQECLNAVSRAFKEVYPHDRRRKCIHMIGEGSVST